MPNLTANIATKDPIIEPPRNRASFYTIPDLLLAAAELIAAAAAGPLVVIATSTKV